MLRIVVTDAQLFEAANSEFVVAILDCLPIMNTYSKTA